MYLKLYLICILLAAFGCSSSTAVIQGHQTRIIGGTTADIARYPYLVSLRYRRNAEQGYLHECAGVIYSDRAVVTAAQCLWNLADSVKLMAVVGATTRNGTDGMIYPVSSWIYHPQFSLITADYDIGVVFLDKPLNLARFVIRTIRLRPERPAVGREATIMGWGYREEWGPSSHQLEDVQVPIVSEEQCTNAYGVGEITERMICAGDMDFGGRDACQGDTGGPLVIEGQLVGLVSWGRGCGRRGLPTVYTYATSLKQWIDDTVATANIA